MKNKINLLIVAIMVIFSAEFNTAYGQVTNAFNAILTGNYVGTSNAFDLNVMTLQNQNINFFTQAVSNTSPVNQAMIISGSNSTLGFVGIGPSFTSPTQLLQVLGGFIDVNTVNMGYMINQDTILWHAGNKTNLFVGVLAGNSGQTGSANI